MGDYNIVSRGYQVDLLSQKGLQVGLIRFRNQELRQLVKVPNF